VITKSKYRLRLINGAKREPDRPLRAVQYAGRMDTMDRPTWPRIILAPLIWVALFGLLAALHYSADIVGPLLIALNLLIAAWPVRTALLRRGVRPMIGTAALGLVVFLVLGLALFVLGWSVSALVKELPSYQGRFSALYAQLVALAASFGITQASVLTQLQQISPSSVAGFASSAVSGVSGALATLGVLVLMVFLLLMDAGSVAARGEALGRFQPHLGLALGDFVVGVRRYWVVTTVFGLIVAMLDLGVLLVLGVPLAFVWAMLSFLTNYIPNVGFVIGIIPPMLMALLDSGPVAALIVVVAYTVINVIIQSVIQPKFNGDAVGVTPLVSFLSLLIWSAVLGPVGALLGLPATLLLKALLVDHDPAMRWFNAFLANDPATADPLEADLADEVPTPEADAAEHDSEIAQDEAASKPPV
jgi:AI-2 transport protein TqsA